MEKPSFDHMTPPAHPSNGTNQMHAIVQHADDPADVLHVEEFDRSAIGHDEALYRGPAMGAPTDVWSDVHQERESLLALLESLTQAEWDAPSLCTGWRVRDVVGHMVSETTMTIPKLLRGLVTSGMRINRFIARDARGRGSLSISELVEGFRAAVPTRTHLAGLSSLSMLEDIIVHSLDIRLALGRAHTVPHGRMNLVATDLRASRFFPGHKLFRDLRVVAIDSEWCSGNGPVVSGPIESLVLVMSGRLAGLEKLQGERMATVHERSKNL
jgi:uncharacterized protein (TIGR03083 family)